MALNLKSGGINTISSSDIKQEANKNLNFNPNIGAVTLQESNAQPLNSTRSFDPDLNALGSEVNANRDAATLIGFGEKQEPNYLLLGGLALVAFWVFK